MSIFLLDSEFTQYRLSEFLKYSSILIKLLKEFDFTAEDLLENERFVTEFQIKNVDLCKVSSMLTQLLL